MNDKSKPKDIDQRRALYHAAVVAQNVDQVAALLKQGVSPDDTYRGRSIFDHAWGAPALPEVIALLLGHRSREVPMNWLWSALADDELTVRHVSAVFDLVRYTDDDFHRRNVSSALDAGHTARQDGRLVEKIRLMVSKGWKPVEAWFEGKLLFHDYLAEGLVEAAWACVEGGVDPHEPMRAHGLESPTKLLGWAELEARLIAQQREEQGTSVVVPRARKRLRT